jgi:hypothetical protein
MTKSTYPSVRPRDPQELLGEMDQPRIRWKIVAQIGVAFLVLWVTAFMVTPYVDYWGVGIVAVLTLVAAGFGFYVWRLTKRSRAIVDILAGATDDAGRKAALERLESGDASDALNGLARAQLVARERPAEAVSILEAIDLKKAPAVVQDDVRANLALMYLMTHRVRDARALADAIRLDRQPHPKAKAMYAAVIAESNARTGKPDDAKKLLETYDANDPAYGEMRAMLLRAQVYTYHATKNRGLARRAMQEMSAIDPNMLGVFVQRGSPPELGKIAREVLAQVGMAPKVKVRARMR